MADPKAAPAAAPDSLIRKLCEAIGPGTAVDLLSELIPLIASYSRSAAIYFLSGTRAYVCKWEPFPAVIIKHKPKETTSKQVLASINATGYRLADVTSSSATGGEIIIAEQRVEVPWMKVPTSVTYAMLIPAPNQDALYLLSGALFGRIDIQTKLFHKLPEGPNIFPVYSFATAIVTHPNDTTGASDVMYQCGGADRFGVITKTLHRFVCATGSWQTVAKAPVPVLIKEHVLLPLSSANSGVIIMIGGGSDNHSNRAGTKVLRYDHALEKWSTLPSMKQGRYRHAAAVLSGYIVVSGGQDADEQPLTSVEVLPLSVAVAEPNYDDVSEHETALADGPQWKVSPTPMNAKRTEHKLCVWNSVGSTGTGGNELYAVGGEDPNRREPVSEVCTLKQGRAGWVTVPDWPLWAFHAGAFSFCSPVVI